MKGALMQNIKEVFSSFSVSDLAQTKKFYSEVLGLKVDDGKEGLILHMVGGGTVFIYPKDNHEPATFTVLNIEVDDIAAAVMELNKNNVELERYDGMGQDEKGISHGKASGHDPDIGWFKDPEGNVISILQR
jgi:catechol 2,3-dioxygenase-like lactoylglutathione lyase family enzyme